MNARELADDIRLLGPQDPHVLLNFIADRIYDATLLSGGRVVDAGDFKEFLQQLADALQGRVQPAMCRRPGPKVTIQEQPRNWDACPRCGHVHQGEMECGEQIGGGRSCRCDLEVPA